MTCPVCGGKTLIIHCFKDCESVYRRRRCKECNHVFNTAEYETDIGKYWTAFYENNKNNEK
jgi:transcriptional regulator NrdR family protein